MTNRDLTAYRCLNFGAVMSPDRYDVVCEPCFQGLSHEAVEALAKFAAAPERPSRANGGLR
jgi:hypothetical protein